MKDIHALPRKITSWKDDQGFGFVIPNGGDEKAFKAFTGRSRRPLEGDFITYEQTIDEKRRFQATNIRFVGEPVVATGRHKNRTLAPFLPFCLLPFWLLPYFQVGSPPPYWRYIWWRAF